LIAALLLPLALLAQGCGHPAPITPAPEPRRTPDAGARRSSSPIWSEHFDHALSWGSPSGQTAREIASVYSLGGDATARFLHARHDARLQTPKRTPAIHYGYALSPAPPLDHVGKLRWRWRVLQHPAPNADAWLDVAASLYVIVRQPGLLRAGAGFKLGWLQTHGPQGARQRGIEQVELRADPAGPAWKQEEVDLCALYRRFYGPCEGEHLDYVGVLTDADGTESIAEADYADFELSCSITTGSACSAR
jgi:hypothetical protein